MPARRSRLALLLLPLTALAGYVGCAAPGDDWPAEPQTRVVTSFAPIHCLTLNVAGPDASVKSVMTSQGPHHFDTKLSEASLLKRANLFVINGLDLDTKVATKLKDASRNPNLKLVELGARVDPKQLLEGACNHEGHDHSDHEHATDPHVWLGPDHAVTFVHAIRDELKLADPAHAAGYDARAAAYVAELKALKAEGKALMAVKKERGVASFHGSLGYFARTFDLNVEAVIQATPGQEPTSRELEAIVETCLHHKVRVIAVEPQYSAQSSAQRLAAELRKRGVVDAAVVEVDPLETANPDELTPGWYVAKMRANLHALAAVLK